MRIKIKRLPFGDNEKEGYDKVKHPQMRSRRFPIKSMFIGVVGRPRPDNFFDVMILLERVSKKHVIKEKQHINALVMMLSSILISRQESGKIFILQDLTSNQMILRN